MPLGSTLLCILRGEYMLINEVCKSTGLTKKAILYYEKEIEEALYKDLGKSDFEAYMKS